MNMKMAPSMIFVLRRWMGIGYYIIEIFLHNIDLNFKMTYKAPLTLLSKICPCACAPKICTVIYYYHNLLFFYNLTGDVRGICY